MSPDLLPEYDQIPIFSVSDAVALLNQIFETAVPTITITGEIANYKVSQGKWVFFDIKDNESSLGCFMSLFNLRTVIEDGMKVAITARPTMTKWGKFSLTVQSIRPMGEGNIKRAFELLRSKLESEGLFDADRKRSLPESPQTIGVISSTGAAGYADFIEILSQRTGGLNVMVANVQVQGQDAAEQIISALRKFNEMAVTPQVIALIRGGGSRDDLVTFDDEPLVRAIAASRIPTIVGVGHEVDTTLADLVADVRAATPSNAAQLLVPDRTHIISNVYSKLENMISQYESEIRSCMNDLNRNRQGMLDRLETVTSGLFDKHHNLLQILRQVDPRLVLNRGYSIVRDGSGSVLHSAPVVGANLMIENAKFIIETEVKNVRTR